MATFPLRKKHVYLNTSKNHFLDNYDEHTEIPLSPHPGAFSVIRKNHIHEGVDLYCNLRDEVIAIEDGVIVNIFPFTGKHCGSPWWNNTWGIMVEGESGVFNYGELQPQNNLKVGMSIKEGEVIGEVLQVLKKDKGRPLNMLHLELYVANTKNAIKEWSLNQNKPQELIDPTNILIEIMQQKSKNNLKI